MSLQDPAKKMSKSDVSDNNVIALLDTPEVILRKFKRSVTDSGTEVLYREDKPGIANLLNILSSTQGDSIKSLEERYRGIGYSKLKSDVAEAVVTLLNPIQHRYTEIRSDRERLNDILRAGAEKARTKAQVTLNSVRDAIGLIPSPR